MSRCNKVTALCRGATLGVTLSLLGLPVLLAAPAQASASKLVFQPGHYVGTTNQTCTKVAAEQVACEVGKKLPISFTVQRAFISHVSTIAIDKCSGKHPDYIHVLHYPQPALIFDDPSKAFFYDEQNIIKNSLSAVNDLIAGFLKGRQASGALESFLILNDKDQLDPLGTTGCNSGIVHWRVKRVGKAS